MNTFDLSPLELTPLTTNQEELINKFNAAFYDAQTLNSLNNCDLSLTGINGVNGINKFEDIEEENLVQNEAIDENEQFLLENLDESFFDNIPDSDNILFPQEITENYETCESSKVSQAEIFKQDEYIDYANLSHHRVNSLTLTDEGFSDGFSEVFSDGLASELITPASDCTSTFDYNEFSENFEQFNQFHSESFYPHDKSNYCLMNQTLPSVNTFKQFKQCNWEFNQFLRHQENHSLDYHHISSEINNFGHCQFLQNQEQVEKTETLTENDSLTFNLENNQENLMILNQSDALLFDDANFFTAPEENSKKLETNDQTFELEQIDSDFDESITHSLQCKWMDCYQIYETQSSLVKHIEKAHVEMKRGDEFTCFWDECPRKTKPFNARYKLLIHMRVHSGEKPNKCPFNGCNKAFSRLENLKIHQRSHTGERPYLCQFPTCSKSFSNSSDRAKHQRTHFDTKPYACLVKNCNKKYTDPSSLRKHVKNHTPEEQRQLKNKNSSSLEEYSTHSSRLSSAKQNNITSTSITTSVMIKQEIIHSTQSVPSQSPDKKVSNSFDNFYANYEHDYTITRVRSSFDVKQDLKNKLSEKMHRNILYK